MKHRLLGLILLLVTTVATACTTTLPPRPAHLRPKPVPVVVVMVVKPEEPKPVTKGYTIPKFNLSADNLRLIYGSPINVSTVSNGNGLKPLSISKKGWSPKKNRKWKYILIHHSATTSGSASLFDKHHRKTKGWKNGLGYDFVIGNGNGAGDGKVEVGPRWEKQIDGAHAGNKEFNKHAIGICLVGNFEATHPSSNQMRALVELVYFMQQKYNIANKNVRLHRDVRKKGPTVCPGKYFDRDQLIRSLAARATFD